MGRPWSGLPRSLPYGIVAGTFIFALASTSPSESIIHPPSQLRDLAPPAWTAGLAPLSERPNVLLVVFDARRRDDFSVEPSGRSRHDTPFLERFSDDAVRFDGVVSPACWTVPVHAALFSGVSSCKLGIDLYHEGFSAFRSDVLSLAEILRLAGYHTVAYADHPFFYSEPLPESLIRGFEQFDVINDFKTFASHTNVGTSDGGVELVHRLSGLSPLSGPDLDALIRQFKHEGEPPSPTPDLDRDPTTGILLPRLAPLFQGSEYFNLRYARQFDAHVFPRAGRKKPYFLFLNLHMCAPRVQPDPGMLQRWFLELLIANAREKGKKLTRRAPQEEVVDTLERNYKELKLSWGRFERPFAYVKQMFDDRFYDATFEALWDFLKARGLTENTLTVVTSDHGMSFGEHGEGFFMHSGSRPYEYLTRVPLVLRFPERSEFRDLHGAYTQRVSLLDVFPTVLDVAVGRGLFKGPQHIEGRSLVDRIRAGRFEEVLVSESSLLPVAYDDQQHLALVGYAKAVYWKNYKLILCPSPIVSVDSKWMPRPRARLEVQAPAGGGASRYRASPGPLTLLYDLSKDVDERQNLAAELPEIVEKLTRYVDATSWECRALPTGTALSGPRQVIRDRAAREAIRSLGYVD